MNISVYLPVASFTKEVDPRLAKRPLVFNGRLANHGLTSLVKEATGGQKDFSQMTSQTDGLVQDCSDPIRCYRCKKNEILTYNAFQGYFLFVHVWWLVYLHCYV